MAWVAAFVSAYLLGSLPVALWFGRALRGIDLREHGSGNLGATNVYRVLGRTHGITVLLLDAAKGALAVGLARWLLPDAGHWPLVAALLLAILGHMFTPFANFRGGKGVATAAGAWAALAPIPLAIALSVWILAFALTRVVSIGSVLAALALPIGTYFAGPRGTRGIEDPVLWTAVATGALLIVRHRENLGRLRRGVEKPLDLRGGSAPAGRARTR